MLNIRKISISYGLLSIVSVFAMSANALLLDPDEADDVIVNKLIFSLNDVDDVTKRIDFYSDCVQNSVIFCKADVIIITKRDDSTIEKKLPFNIANDLRQFAGGFNYDSANIITEENNPVCNVALSNHSTTLTFAVDIDKIILSSDKCKNHVIRPKKDKAYSDAKSVKDLLIEGAQMEEDDFSGSVAKISE
jgi:hypothetical protein